MTLEVQTHNDGNIDVNGTCLQGYVHGPGQKLVEKFGEPLLGYPDDKVEYEWNLKVKGKPKSAALKLEQLVNRCVGKTRYTSDTITYGNYPPHLGLFQAWLETFKVFLDSGGNVRRVDRQFSHFSLSSLIARRLAKALTKLV